MKTLADMFTIGPANKDHHPALRCAVGIFVPLISLTLLGRLDLAVFASFGAFTGIYGRNEPHAQRFRSQLRAGSLMFAVVLLATLMARLRSVLDGAGSDGGLGLDGGSYLWLLVLATTLVAGASSVVAALWRLRPSGSLFQIFAFAAIASIPQQPPLAEALLTCAATVAFCLALGMSSRVVKSHRVPWRWPAPQRLTGPERRTAYLEGIGYLLAAGLAGSLATVVGEALGFGHNYWAMVAAVVPLVGHTTRHRVSRGLQRIAGTVAGLVLMAGIIWLAPSPWLMILIIAICQFGAELYITRQYMVAQVFVTPIALLSTLLAAPGAAPGILLRDRIVETVIGAAVGVVVVTAPAVWAAMRRPAQPKRASWR
ncbi:FUSC family protein [Arthrobacter sp. M4]|uniref:FUSC family protein n=1 Tax=Arthrobacter sp. M4 TaxID=218160 RepID=UPI001CDD2B2B|nr:FUSC family protein [Arthrobacter sp. M4]MCA4133477.1 FUSC family protein [Arthrobacter sp. M4]